jgi:hypothetical protein
LNLNDLGLLTLIVLLLGGIATLGGCDQPGGEFHVNQPIAFDHRGHVTYLSSGKHRDEKIEIHLEILGEEEAPEEIVRGMCMECHENLVEETPKCAGCHVIFQDAALRARQDIRACVACHRKAWTGHIASIPSVTVCSSCHADKPRTNSKQEKRLREYIDRGEDIPWLQITAMDPHTHFSHKAHVRYAGYACTLCHNDILQQDSQQTAVQEFTMSNCIRCHEENNAANECLTCHK